jgi:nascent polypeptide-associated complex subunit alpha
MIPGINPRQMQSIMKKMGIQPVEIPATEVIIKTEDKEIVITNPQVSKVNLMGQQTYQIIGEAHERIKTTEADFSEEDIKTIMEQANCSENEAITALQKTGNLAQAVIELNNPQE